MRTLVRVMSVIHLLVFLPPIAFYCCAAYFEIWDSVISDQPLVGCCILPVDQYLVLHDTYKTMTALKLKREELLVPLRGCKLIANDTTATLPQRGLKNHEVLSLTMPPDSFKVYEWAHDRGYVVCKHLRDKVIVRYVTAVLSVGTLAMAYCTAKVLLEHVWRTFAHPPPRRPPRDAVQDG